METQPGPDHRHRTPRTQAPPPLERPLFDADGRTDRGKTRAVNEDQFLVADLRRSMLIRNSGLPGGGASLSSAQGTLLAVADGIGGHGGGKIASEVVLQAVAQHVLSAMPWFWHGDTLSASAVLEDLERAFAGCCEMLDRVVAYQGISALRPGATLTMAYVVGHSMYLLHAGDSRCYLLRDGEARPLTEDHTLAQKLAQSRGVDGRQYEGSALQNVLVNAVGGGLRDVSPEVRCVALAPGDAVLLCSDGLTRHVSDAMIASIVAATPTAALACERLIEAANRAGGHDNVTAVVGRVG